MFVFLIKMYLYCNTFSHTSILSFHFDIFDKQEFVICKAFMLKLSNIPNFSQFICTITIVLVGMDKILCKCLSNV